jgi:small subunit ribosomal protein S3
MGQKVHPVGFRVGISRGWDSVWFAEKKDYTRFLHEDLEIRNFLKKKLKEAQISKIEIRRRGYEKGFDIDIEIHAAKPGVIYGRKSKGLELLKGELKKFTSNNPRIYVIQIRKAELQA